MFSLFNDTWVLKPIHSILANWNHLSSLECGLGYLQNCKLNPFVVFGYFFFLNRGGVGAGQWAYSYLIASTKGYKIAIANAIACARSLNQHQRFGKNSCSACCFSGWQQAASHEPLRLEGCILTDNVLLYVLLKNNFCLCVCNPHCRESDSQLTRSRLLKSIANIILVFFFYVYFCYYHKDSQKREYESSSNF